MPLPLKSSRFSTEEGSITTARISSLFILVVLLLLLPGSQKIGQVSVFGGGEGLGLRGQSVGLRIRSLPGRRISLLQARPCGENTRPFH
jgi:hypothetical protein